jgi:hypothetical protein
MVDLQRIMDGIWNIVRAPMQDVAGNSDMVASADSKSSGKFSVPRLDREYFFAPI